MPPYRLAKQLSSSRFRRQERKATDDEEEDDFAQDHHRDRRGDAPSAMRTPISPVRRACGRYETSARPLKQSERGADPELRGSNRSGAHRAEQRQSGKGDRGATGRGAVRPGYREFSSLQPAHARGLACLQLGKGPEATREFQKRIDNRGAVFDSILGALGRLQRAGAEALNGNLDAARTDYQDFLALWKDADPDIPVLQQAKVEYEKLN